MKLPIVKNSDDLGTLGVILVNNEINSMGHIFRDNVTRDFGIDGQIEIVIKSSDERRASGRLVAVQIKCGMSFFGRDDGNNWVHYCSESHANYWENYSIPVVLILCNPETRDCYWNLIDKNSLIRTNEGAKVLIPMSKRLAGAQKELESLSYNKNIDTIIFSKNRFVFSLNENYELILSEDELEVFCGEISHACLNESNVFLDVSFENEVLVINEADKIRTEKDISVEMRRRLLELQEIHMWFSDKRKMITQGLNFIFKEGFFKDFFILDNNYTDLAKAVKGFIRYYIYERVSKTRTISLTLDVFPNKKYSDLVVRIDLDKGEQESFLSKIGTNGSTVPLMYPGYYFSDLNHSIAIERGIPAALTYIIFYLRNKKLDENDFFSQDLEPLLEWRLGLA